MFAAAEFADEKAYYKGQLGKVVGTADATAAGARNWTAGLAVYDISNPAEPRRIGFMPVEGGGIHRVWYTGGRWAYASALIDAGMVVIDVTDRTKPALISHCDGAPPFSGGTHNCLPLPDRDLLVVLDEAVLDHQEDGVKHIWMFDNRVKSNPVSIATFPQPTETDYKSKGGHFGPHNIHENRPGSFVSSELIFATYQNAGVRVFDIRDQHRPKEAGAWVPPAPVRMMDRRPNRARVIQSADVFVDAAGLIYSTDYNAGLFILEFGG
jgi:hypothetical protein